MVAGRLRIKLPILKKNPAKARELEKLLRSFAGVKQVSTNSMTGSVIILFDEKIIGSDGLLIFLAQEGYIDIFQLISGKKREESPASHIGQAASKALLGFALGRAFQGTPLAFISAFI
jgi:hypothetical protein